MAQQNPFEADMRRMRIPDGMGTNVSVSGFNLEADKDRCVTVPSSLAKELENHGLVAAPKVQPLGVPHK